MADGVVPCHSELSLVEDPSAVVVGADGCALPRPIGRRRRLARGQGHASSRAPAHDREPGGVRNLRAVVPAILHRVPAANGTDRCVVCRQVEVADRCVRGGVDASSQTGRRAVCRRIKITERRVRRGVHAAEPALVRVVRVRCGTQHATVSIEHGDTRRGIAQNAPSRSQVICR
jgi:hypothetical protein